MKNKIDSYEKGDLINGVIFIKHLTKGTKRKAIFLCMDCGKETEKRIDHVKSNGSKFCKQCATKKLYNSIKTNVKTPDENSLRKAAYRAIRKSAKDRCKYFELDFDFLINEIKKNCNYCGIKPNQLKQKGLNKFFHHGLDRVDNNLGYIKSNVVSCCRTCNNAKASQTQIEWKEYINRLINFNKKSF